MILKLALYSRSIFSLHVLYLILFVDFLSPRVFLACLFLVLVKQTMTHLKLILSRRMLNPFPFVSIMSNALVGKKKKKPSKKRLKVEKMLVRNKKSSNPFPVIW